MVSLDEVIGRVRAYIQDNVAPYRYSDTEVMYQLNSGIINIVELRPDLFISPPYYRDTVLSTAKFSPPDVGLTPPAEVPIPLFVIEPLCMYVAAHLEIRDDEFAQDGRVASLMQQFRYRLTGR